MKHCSLNCAGIWPFLFLPLLLLAPLLYFLWHPIEQRVAANVSQVLAKQHSWAKVETFNRGRDVLLIGTAPNSKALEDARNLAITSEGARVVDFVGEIQPPQVKQTSPVVKLKPSKFSIKFTGGQVVLSGTVDSQATIDALVSEAILKYGQERVIDRLKVGSNLAPLLTGAKTFTLGRQVADGVNIEFAENTLVLTGSVNSEEQRDAITTEYAQVFAGEINSLLTVNKELITNKECQNLINDLLRNTKINFETGKATISSSSKELIQNMASTAARCPDATFEVMGHTDSTGKLDLNMVLSEQRAQAVVDRIVSLNLKAERFSASGYGPNQPIGDNDTKQGRAENRRIEFKIKSNY